MPVEPAALVPPAAAVGAAARVAVVRVDEDRNRVLPAHLDARNVVEPEAEGRVAARMRAGERSIDPNCRVAERALKVDPHRGASPRGRQLECLPVPEHVAWDVRLSRAAIRARVLGGCRGDQPVVRELHVLPAVVRVRHLGLRRGCARIGIDWRLIVGLRPVVQPRAVLPAKVEGDDVARGRADENCECQHDYSRLAAWPFMADGR
eukprot:5181957-Prymnesium_polylepis.1